MVRGPAYGRDAVVDGDLSYNWDLSGTLPSGLATLVGLSYLNIFVTQGVCFCRPAGLGAG